MEKKQAQNLVRDTLQNDFNKDQFTHFVRNLLNHIEEAPFVNRGNIIPDAYKKYISTLERVGKYTDGENKIDILIVKLCKNTSLERARTAQRNFIARYLNGSRGGEQKDAALVAFVSPNEVDWRFSLIKMDYKFVEEKNGKTKVKEEFTPAKRWSFLVGRNENSHTAQSRLAPMVEDDQFNPTLKQLEEAFNIEKVTKEFFEKYREIFLRVYETLNDVVEHNLDIKSDFAEKNVNIADFSKKLLGQIVFLYFLQKKGWFGVPMDKGWGGGDKKFLRTRFEESSNKDKNYFNDYLEPLFYEALAKERDGDFYGRFDCKIPFLNGGLFDPISNYDWVNTVIDLPNDLFSNTRKDKNGDIGDGILDIFDRYNFTVKEDEPLEKEVAVDPEMLGKVFENLLEVKDRKSKGTYYTPREIVKYMCQQSLLNYLKTNTQVDKEKIEKLVLGKNLPSEEVLKLELEDMEEGDLETIVDAYVLLDKREIKELDTALSNIKVVDPACGSGAFLVGMLNEIVNIRHYLAIWYLKWVSNYNLKKETIENCIYGVDLDPGAVEIAKLRLWLSLVVDEEDIKQIKPLPNLDYKIMQGNSLLEEFEGIKLFDEKLLETPVINASMFEADNQRILKLQSELLQKYYIKNPEWLRNKATNRPDEVRRLEKQLYELMKKKKKVAGEDYEQKDLFSDVAPSSQIRDELESLHKRFFNETDGTKKKDLKERIEKLEWELIEVTLKEQNKISALKKLEEFKLSNTKPFFLWKLNFAEVFEGEGGFDIVIENPPYVRVDEIDSDLKDAYKRGFVTAKGKYDLYYLFFEKAFYLVNQKGFCIFISPNKFCAADSAFNLRKLMFEDMYIQEILSTSKLKIFDSASNYPVISSLLKHCDEQKMLIRQVTELGLLNEKVLPNSYLADPHDLCKLPNAVIPINTNQVAVSLIQKLYEPTLYFSNIISISEGLRIPAQFELKEKLDFKIVKQYQFTRYSDIKEGSHISEENLKEVISESSERYLKIKSKKILIAEDALMISATIDNEMMIPQGGVYFGICLGGTISAEFMIGILNSNLLSFIYEVLYAGMHMGGGYLRFRSKFLESLPITEKILEPNNNASDQVIKLVNQRLSLNASADFEINLEKQAKIRGIENQIDKLVYKLYDLTPEEIKIVENASKK